MKVKYTAGEQVFHAFVVLVTLLLSLAVVIPLMSIVFASFSDPYEVMKHSGLYWKPIKFSLYNYNTISFFEFCYHFVRDNSYILSLCIVACYAESKPIARVFHRQDIVSETYLVHLVLCLIDVWLIGLLQRCSYFNIFLVGNHACLYGCIAFKWYLNAIQMLLE